MNRLSSYLLRKADVARDKRNFTVARRWYRLCLTQDSSNAAAWIQLGHALKETFRFNSALRSYEKARVLLGDDNDLYLQMGHLYKVMNRMEDAVASYLKAHKLGNTFAAAELITLLEKEDIDQKIRISIMNSGLILKSTSQAKSKNLAPLSQEIVTSMHDLLRHEPGSPQWKSLIDQAPSIHEVPTGYAGFIEGAFVSVNGDGVVFGWALHPEGGVVWLEDGAGNVYALEKAFRRKRRDIAEAFKDIPWSDMKSEFLAYVPSLADAGVMRLRYLTTEGAGVLSERLGAERIADDPRKAAEKLFSIETEEPLFHERSLKVDWPLLAPLIRRYQDQINQLKPDVKTFGPCREEPKISIIVPLYKRFDFIEHQMLEFARDEEFKDHCEIIYVLDDPTIKADLLSEAIGLYQLYSVPFKIVDGRKNRGFSGANNLGSDHAQGEYLLFINSDVIPSEPGWIGRMLVCFEDDRTGVVGAQLMYPGGGTQHAGMEFRFFEQLGIWINYHPNSGLQRECESTRPRQMPAVTGACMMVPRKIFDLVGGWSADYLIGDFEDSDLCLAIRAKGYNVMYQPSAQLFHLERQSFSGIGADWFRHRMTICNAALHYQKWGALIG